MRVSPQASSEINLQITPPIRSSPIDEWFDINAYQPGVKAGVESGVISRIESGVESEIELESEPTTVVVQFGDPVIQQAQEATKNARDKMAQKYSKKHDIQHFDVGDIVSLKVPREDRTSTDNRRLFGQILGEPYSHRYKVLTCSGIIKHLIPTEELGVVATAIWSDIIIPETTNEVTLELAAREASTSAQVGISCQCKGPCNIKSCKCHKECKQCSAHYHRDGSYSY
jgi:hypothetical protein